MRYKKQIGFTLIELMVGVAILAIISTLALPNLNQFLVEMRVDSEISKLNRMIITARNIHHVRNAFDPKRRS
jgi:type IV fimbrial biogenesis protein FimT